MEYEIIPFSHCGSGNCAHAQIDALSTTSLYPNTAMMVDTSGCMSPTDTTRSRSLHIQMNRRPSRHPDIIQACITATERTQIRNIPVTHDGRSLLQLPHS